MHSEDPEDEDIVLNYLLKILKAVQSIFNERESIETLLESSLELNKKSNKSADFYIDQIARDLLLRACDPSTLALPVEFDFPRKLNDGGDQTSSSKNADKNTNGNYSVRTHYLQNILRCMSPIAFDVGARIISIVKSSEPVVVVTGLTQLPGAITVKAFILFSYWLPIAPQLCPLISDLFALKSFGCPFRDVISKYSNEDTMHIDGSMDNEMVLNTNHIFIICEATYNITSFFYYRGEHHVLQKWWDWTPMINVLSLASVPVSDLKAADFALKEYRITASRWYAARAVTFYCNFSPQSRAIYLKKLFLQEEIVPWTHHPWNALDWEITVQNNQILGTCNVIIRGVNVQMKFPSASQIRKSITLHPYLIHLGEGILLPCKDQSFHDPPTIFEENKRHQLNNIKIRDGSLILTTTTSRNLSLLGMALSTDPYPPPILICGPRGSGKSSLIRELVQLCSPFNNTGAQSEDLLELHVDEETDSKTLIGSYVSTDIPGEFTWRPGALTNAVLEGKWVLLEDVDTCPTEIQASLVKLLEERILPLGTGRAQKCHPNFRMFGTCSVDTILSNMKNNTGALQQRPLRRGVTSVGSRGKRLLQPGLWRKIHVKPLTHPELKFVSQKLHPLLPEMIVEAALTIYKRLDKSGREEETNIAIDSETMHSKTMDTSVGHEEDRDVVNVVDRILSRMGNSRFVSVRDLMKLLGRISSTVQFEPGIAFCTESQRIGCMAESIDVFTGWVPCVQSKKELIRYVIAPAWDISCDVATRYLEERQPKIEKTRYHISIGRSKISHPGALQQKDIGSNFTETNHALRLMESICICISQNEPTLLVGGKVLPKMI